MFCPNLTITIKEAERLHNEIENSFIPQQFENPATPLIHEKLTGEEIWTDTDGKVDIVISAAGTGGTATGIARAIKAKKEDFKQIVVEPASSPVLTKGEKGAHKIQVQHKCDRSRRYDRRRRVGKDIQDVRLR